MPKVSYLIFGLIGLLLLARSFEKAREPEISIKVGDYIRSFSGSSVTGIHISPTEPKGKFYMHLISPDFPPGCLDLECGIEAKPVTDKGGHLIASGDGKYASRLGIDLVRLGTTKSFPIAIITDEKAKVIRIQKNVSMKDIHLLINKLQL